MMEFSQSLQKNADFLAVYGKKKSYADHLLVIYIAENHTQKNRLGISVSKKVGNSVVRHKVKRLIRESYRLQEEKFRRGYDIVVIARAAAKDRTYKEIESALMHVAARHKILL